MDVYRAPLIVFLCALAATVGLAAYVRYEERARLQDHMDGIAIYTAHWMEDRIDADLDAVDRLILRWYGSAGLDWSDWEDDARSYVQDFPEIRAIEWADPAFQIQRIVPLEGNEEAQGIVLTEVLEEGDRLVEAAHAGDIFTTSAIDLVQGGVGFVAYHPLFREGEFDGLMIAVFDVNRLAALLAESEFGRETVISFGQHNRIFGVTSYGATDGYSSEGSTHLAGREWQVTIHAKPILLDRFFTWNPLLALLIGAGLSAVLARAVYVSQRARKKQRESEAAQEHLGDELASANKRFEAAVSGASVGIWDWVDVNDEELWCSPVFNKLLGYPPNKCLTVTSFFEQIVHPDDRERFTECVVVHLNDDAPFRVDYRLKHASGDYRWFIGSGAAIRNAQGEPIRMLGSIMDIHELKETQHSLERASRAKSDFLANMSHEIRTPMNGILGMTSVLLMSDLPGEIRENLDIIKASGDAMMEIVNDILDISKIEAGRFTIENEPLEVEGALHRCISLHSAPAVAKGVSVVVDVPGPLIAGIIYGDEGRLMQVLGNLVSNAIKFTPYGEVKVRATQDIVDGGKIQTRFEISDTGIGIPDDKISEIFEPFSQADGSTTRQFGGTGLGLSIAQHLATMMGGDMGATSKMGEGSTFWFTIVSEPGDAKFGAPEKTADAEQPGRLRA